MNETRTKTPAGEGFADMIFMTGNTYPKQGTLGHKEKTQDPSGRNKKKKKRQARESESIRVRGLTAKEEYGVAGCCW